MIKLNDNNIYVGQIKQLLHTFNLPTCPIGEINKQPNKFYITKDSIFYCDEDLNSQYMGIYIPGKYYQNLTSTLDITNTVYDRTTHRYLGKYLRYLKDYKNINLLSMYNVFDGEPLSKSVFITDFNKGGEEIVENISTFDVDARNYVCYQIPIQSLVYTLKINCQLPIEMCITFFDTLFNSQETLDNFENITYRKMKVSKPTILNIQDLLSGALDSEDEDKAYEYKDFYNKYKSEMHLIIKIPTSYKGSITLLEGDYTQNYYNASSLMYYPETSSKNSSLQISGFYIRPQLFSYLNAESDNLLADRLLEYLVDNPITSGSEEYDIKKAQNFLRTFIDDEDSSLLVKSNGIWGNVESVLVKQFCIDGGRYNLCDSSFDIIGFIDKDVEKEINIYCNKSNKEGVI